MTRCARTVSGFLAASWSGDVNALLANLRDALVALAGVAERAQISWRDGEAYDDWDHLASCAYDVFVARPIGADGRAAAALPLAAYDMRLPTYSEHSSVMTVSEDGSVLLFNRLLAGAGDFAAAETVRATLAGVLVAADPVVVLPLESVAVVLLCRRNGGETRLLERITSDP